MRDIDVVNPSGTVPNDISSEKHRRRIKGVRIQLGGDDRGLKCRRHRVGVESYTERSKQSSKLILSEKKIQEISLMELPLSLA